MITAEQARQYLDSLGISVPAVVLTAAMDEVEAREPLMAAAGYGEAQQVLVQSMAVALVAAAGAPRRLSSQAAPSGASRSFKYTDRDLTALRRTLAYRDPAGTVADLVGPDPVSGTLLLVVG